MYDYKSLPLPSSTPQSDSNLAASWCHTSNGEFVSYDTPAVVCAKVDYIKKEGLGGAMFWELSCVFRNLSLSKRN